MKTLIAALHANIERKTEACPVKECDAGELYSSRERDYSLRCPSCSKWRELKAKWCWHEIPESKYWYSEWECSCGETGINTVNRRAHLNSNPTPSIETLRGLLESLGNWDWFAGNWLWDYSLLPENNKPYYDIITKPTLLTQAITTYLEVKV